MSKIVIKGVQRNTATSTNFHPINNNKPKKREYIQVKLSETKEFLKIFRQVYERHVRSYRKNIFPLQEIDQTSIDITSYIAPKRLQTPNIVDVQLNKIAIEIKPRRPEKFSLRPLPLLKQGKENMVVQEEFTKVTRRSEYKRFKTPLVKRLPPRIPTQSNQTPRYHLKSLIPYRAQPHQFKNQKGEEFDRWQTQSNWSSDENIILPTWN